MNFYNVDLPLGPFLCTMSFLDTTFQETLCRSSPFTAPTTTGIESRWAHVDIAAIVIVFTKVLCAYEVQSKYIRRKMWQKSLLSRTAVLQDAVEHPHSYCSHRTQVFSNFCRLAAEAE